MRHYIQLHLLVILLATTAAWGALAKISPNGLMLWRTLLASLGAAAWFSLVKRKSPWPGGRMAGKLMGVGAIVGVHWLCFFSAIKMAEGGISICMAGLATISLFTSFTEPLMEKRRIRPFEVLLGLLVLVGIGMIAGSMTAQWKALGVAILGGFLASIFPVLNRKLVTGGTDPQVMVTWEMAGACAMMAALYPWLGGGESLLNWQGLDWLWILLLAWVCTVFAHGFHIRLLRHLSAYTTNLAFNAEPVYGVLIAILFFGESKELKWPFYLGMGTILLANVLHPLILRRLAKPVV